jgi:hypothetical protein
MAPLLPSILGTWIKSWGVGCAWNSRTGEEILVSAGVAEKFCVPIHRPLVLSHEQPTGISERGIFVKIVLKIGSIKLLQGFIQILGAVYIDSIIFDHHSRKPLAKLDVHVLQKGAVR